MKYIIGNQKNYLLNEDAKEFAKEYSKIKSKNKVIICPSFSYLPYFKKGIVGVQNVSSASDGPYTGELTSKQLSSQGIKYCIVGHSERRKKLKEKDSDINNKINELLKENIIPILCIGEDFNEKENKLTKTVLKKEIYGSLKKLSTDSVDKIIIAYEPIWAISDGTHPSAIPTNKEIEEIITFIKELIKKKFKINAKVLYGGSVNPNNVDELNKISVVDGYLIGGACKKISDFSSIIDKCE